MADEGVQRLIRRRIGTYPEKAKADMHHARYLEGGGANDFARLLRCAPSPNKRIYPL